MGQRRVHGQSPPRQGRGNTMRCQDLVLLVVSLSVASTAATEEKSIQTRSVETLLSRLSFNPFTPFPELVTTTPTPTLSPTATPRPSSPRPLFKKTKLEKRKKKKFPVFVAVDYATTQRTILPTFVESEKAGNTIEYVEDVKTGKEEYKKSVTNSVSGLSDKEWVASILRRTTTRRPPSQTFSQQLKGNNPAPQVQEDAMPRFKTNKAIDWTPAQHKVTEQGQSEELPELIQNIILGQTKKTSVSRPELSVPGYYSPEQSPDQQGYPNYSPLALRLFQPRQDLQHTVEQQQINHQQFLQKNRHRLFAHMSTTQSHQPQKIQQSQQNQQYKQLQQNQQYQQLQQYQQSQPYQQDQQSQQYQVNNQGLNFKSVDSNYQTQ